MATTQDLKINITADASQAIRQLRRVQRQLWWMQYHGFIIAALGLALGFLIGLQF